MITALLLLQGCSSKEKFSTEQLQNLTNSVTINQLEKTEFNVGENKLVITTNEEVVTKEELDKLLSTLKINNFSGKQLVEKSINSREFDNKDFNIEIVTKNSNSISFNTSSVDNKKYSVDNKKYSVDNKKYSVDYIKNKLSNFTKDLIALDELAGTIETDLNKGRGLENKVNSFNEVKERITSDITFFKSLSSENTEYDKLNELTSRLSRIEKLTPVIINAVNSSIASKNGSAIASAFLIINDIDRLARELAKI